MLPCSTQQKFYFFFAVLWNAFPVPRSKPLPQREIEICRRVRRIREYIGMSRVRLAKELRIDSSILTRIELARLPLKYGVAYRLITFLNLNHEWLAIGKGKPTDPVMAAPGPGVFGTDENSFFSEIFDKFIAGRLAKSCQVPPNDDAYDFVFDPSLAGRITFEEFLLEHLSEWIVLVPDGKLNDFSSKLLRFGYSLLKSYPSESTDLVSKRRQEFAAERLVFLARRKFLAESILGAENISAKKPLTNVPMSDNLSSVITEMPELLAKVKVLTRAAWGSQTRLAEYLGVPTSRVSEWLSGVCEPDGRNTLRLSAWSTAEEARQQKNLASATNTSKAKTRKSKSSYEKPKSSPPKR